MAGSAGFPAASASRGSSRCGRGVVASLRTTQTHYRKAFPFGSAPPKALSRGPLKGPPLRRLRDGSLPHGRAALRWLSFGGVRMIENKTYSVYKSIRPPRRAELEEIERAVAEVRGGPRRWWLR